MSKRHLAGWGVFLVVAGIAAFFIVKQIETKSRLGEPEYSTTPTQWGEAGDYKIEEVSEGTIVTNERAGFSFRIPEGWSGDAQEYEPQKFLFEMASPDARPYEGQVILQDGCAVTIAFQYEPDSTQASVLRAEIEGDLSEGQEVVTVADHQGLKTVSEWLSTLITIELPVDNDILLIDGEFSKDDCSPIFEEFLNSFIISQLSVSL